MNMENLSVKLGDLHLSFKSKIEIPKCQIDTWNDTLDIISCIAEVACGIQGVLSSEYQEDGRGFCTGKNRALKLYASMRNTKKCAIVSQTHFRNAQDLTEL